MEEKSLVEVLFPFLVFIHFCVMASKVLSAEKLAVQALEVKIVVFYKKT